MNSQTNNAEGGLLEIADGCIKTFGYEFSSEVRESVLQMIQTGIEESGASTNPNHLQSVQLSLVVLVNQIASKVDSPSGVIDKTIFLKIKKILCPFPPFWKAPC